MRRPANLPDLVLTQTNNSLGEEVRTPHPFTPVTVPEYPLAMTPDTPGFELGSFQMSSIKSTKADHPWTEDEEGIVQSYLMNPPRLLSTQYPPGTLPPPAALDEIATQIIQCTTHSWVHDWASTRRKVFNIARAESMRATGGHRRKISDIIPAINPITAGPGQHLAGLGGASMDRRQNSMDSLYENGERGVSEALRLSSTLLGTAQDSQSFLTSTDSLCSPLNFTFNFTPTGPTQTPPSRKTSFPFPSGSASIPRPASLLQRGRSFTREDMAVELGMKPLTEEAVMDHDNSSSTSSPDRPDTKRSSNSPLSTFTCSPPSSVSSLAMSEDEPEMELEPYTPLNRTFPQSALMLRTNSETSSSDQTTPSGSGSQTPAITLTAESPIKSPIDRSITPRLISSTNDSPAPAFAALSLNGPTQLTFPTPTAPTEPVSKGVKRSIKPGSLSRSFSDSVAVNASFGIPTESSGSLPTKRLKPLGLSGSRFKSNGPGLSVLVPRQGHVGAFPEELRSPFEPKPVQQ